MTETNNIQIMDIDTTDIDTANIEPKVENKERKRGALSTEEKIYIEKAVEANQPFEKIAVALNRNVDPIMRYAYERGLDTATTQENVDRNRLADKLRGRIYWKDVQQQFTRDELKYFESLWIDLIRQFREDVLYSEELQIKQLITIEILLGRCMKDRQNHMQSIERLQAAVEEENAKGDFKDFAILTSLEQNLAFARNSISTYTQEYTKLLEKQQALQKDLKSTRDQRIKRVEDSKTSWAGYLRALEDENVREAEGKQAELLALAKDKEKKHVAEYHTFMDGMVDRPLLTPEIIMENVDASRQETN